jgi:hypothetical protein
METRFSRIVINYKLTKLIGIYGEQYIRDTFMNYGINKSNINNAVIKMYKLFNDTYINNTCNEIINNYHDMHNNVTGPSYRQYVNNNITLDTDNLILDKEFINVALSKSTSKKNTSQRNYYLQLLEKYIIVSIILIWANKNIVASLIDNDKTRLDNILHIYIKNKIISDCLSTISREIVGIVHTSVPGTTINKDSGQNNNNPVNYINDIRYEYFQFHMPNIISMLTTDTLKIHFITLE